MENKSLELQEALKTGQIERAKALLRRGLDPNEVETADYFAVKTRDLELVEMVVERMNQPLFLNDSLGSLVKDGCLELVKFILDRGLDLGAAFAGRPLNPLQDAILVQRDAMAALLVRRGAPLEVVEVSSRRPLLLSASWCGLAETVRAMLEQAPP